MAAPMTGSMTATQLVEQQQKSQEGASLKQGQSKFDHLMASKAQEAQSTTSAQKPGAAQSASQVNQVRQVQEAGKADKIQLNKLSTALNNNGVSSAPPVHGKAEVNKAVAMMSNMVGEMEKGQGMLDHLINAGLHGMKFNNTELLSLQAGMYKYTQELDLTGKVVDNATSALKDTLKTQV
jgi:hypothetical protein